MASSEFEALRQQGFPGLRFPSAVERHFQADQAPERLGQLQMGALLSILLSGGMLAADWMMVPDRFSQAIILRLLIYAPVVGLSAALLHRMRAAWWEWVALIKSLLATVITIYLCLRSADILAQLYLVSLSVILLFNCGVERIRFWSAVVIDLVIMILFMAAVLNIQNPYIPVLIGMALIMVSTVLSNLYCSYWQEYEERTNWLMQQHEHLLLERLASGNRRLEQLARFDPLTEIANRRHFNEFLEQVWSRARKDGQDVALLMMDIDHFKRYNDHYGHPAGDACLKEVAATISSRLRRPGDLVARFGGEEFIAVLSQTSLPEALIAAERARESVLRLRRPHEASLVLPWVTLSIGVACLRADAPQANIAQLMAQADEALYKAKSRGRNQACALSEARQA